MQENIFLISKEPPERRHADKYKKIMIGGKNLPWKTEDYRSADYFVNKGYTVWTLTPEPIWGLKNEWRTGSHVRQY